MICKTTDDLISFCFVTIHKKADNYSAENGNWFKVLAGSEHVKIPSTEVAQVKP